MARRILDSKYYNFRQHNSGGTWNLTPPLGHVILVEAWDAQDAKNRAEALGVDFEDTNDDSGDRWDDTDYDKGTHEPEASRWLNYEGFSWISDVVVSVCHLDGSNERFEKMAGHVWSSSGDAMAEINTRKPFLEILEGIGSLSHGCEYYGSSRAFCALRDKRDGRTFLVSKHAAKILGLTDD